ncbi:MAG: hypothetical protein U9M95_05680 [Candidatus Altiarchaeota archaeon]|nr:hypothetical protein [Candidatus Altiarchaeota archaeon]
MVSGLVASAILWIVLVGGLSFLFRGGISSFILKIPFPKSLLFLVTGTIYSIIEENINCPPTGCEIIPWTIPIFVIFLIIHLSILKIFRIKNYKIAIFIFGIIGWISEFIFGSYKEWLWSSPAVTILMSIWCFFTFSVIVIVPVTILFKNKKQPAR